MVSSIASIISAGPLSSRLGAAACAALLGLGAIGCGSDPGGDDGTQPTAKLDSAAKIEGFVEGKALVMEGDDIPTHPNGFLADVNLEQATQCYHKVEMALSGAAFHVQSEMGTLADAPNKGDVGKCEKAEVSGKLEFNSTSYLVENVEGDATCFDFTITYTGFAQEGRGAIDADRTSLELEIFFKDQATGIRCADGAPGSGGIQLNGAAFEGDAVQVYRIAE